LFVTFSTMCSVGPALGLVFNLTKSRPKPKIVYAKNATKML